MVCRFAGKTAVVTGASRGIGRAVSLALAREGARVALVARSEEDLEQVRSQIAREGAPNETAREARSAQGAGPATSIESAAPSQTTASQGPAAAGEPPAWVELADVADPGQVEAMARRVVERAGVPDLLINNAGVGHWSPFVDTDPERVARIMEVNFFGSLRCTRAFLPGMLERGSGSVVFVTSGLGEFPFPRSSIYCASKFALHGFARSLRAEVGPRGVHVMLMMPGGTDTAFFTDNDFPRQAVQRYLSSDLDPPEAVAERLLWGLANGKGRVTMSRRTDLALRLTYLFPGLTERLLRRFGDEMARSGAGGRATDD